MFLLWFFGNGWNTANGDDDDFQSGLDQKSNLLRAATILTWILRSNPSFCLANGLFYAINLGDGDNFIKGGTVTSVWHDDVLLYEVIFLVVQSFLYLLLAIRFDLLSHSPLVMGIFDRRAPRDRELAGQDDDVIEEEKRVKSGATSNDLITMTDIQKIYGNGTVAVDQLSLGIAAGECFGLLGTNGMVDLPAKSFCVFASSHHSLITFL